MKIGNFGTIHVKGSDRHAAGNIIPVTHNVFVNLTHGKGATLYENETRAKALFVCLCYLVATHALVIVIPACGFGFVVFLFSEQAIFTRSKNSRAGYQNQ